MKTSPSRFALVRSHRLLSAHFLIVCAGLICAPVALGQGQAGGDTPTGLAGGFGGSITTGGGSFDPYERNATRSITDIVVPGAVVPFTYTRIWNSRSGWRDNWSWSLEEIIASDGSGTGNDLFKGYNIHYPDGRVVKFNKPSQPPHAPLGTPGTYLPGVGILDRLVIQPDGSRQLSMADGSVVNFSGQDATSIVDPHGLAITFSYDSGCGCRVVTEPGGRKIIFHPPQYSNNNKTITSVVTTSLGQTVTYVTSYYTNGSYDYAPGSTIGPDDDRIRTNRGIVIYNDVIDPTTGQSIEAHYVYKWGKANRGRV